MPSPGPSGFPGCQGVRHTPHSLCLETIEINLGGTADAAAEILLMDKYRMIFVHAYSADGKTIGEIVTKSIYGDNVTPATNNTIISIHVGTWASGTVIMSYNKELPSFSIK